jgi:hypothetical protein
VQFYPSPEPVVSVIIVATGAAPDLLGCLRALAVNTRDVPFEAIVVENGVEPSVSDALAFEVSGVTIVRSGEQGLCGRLQPGGEQGARRLSGSAERRRRT